MRSLMVAMFVLLGSTMAARAEVHVGISIGINVPVYPHLAVVPGYPVYYDPDIDGNYFFYDGQYWVYANDVWYASSWYNGPWIVVEPVYVPVFVLRVPVRYYRRPPVYFAGWQRDAPPRWGEHWGRDWERRRSGWDRWDRHAVPRAAPLPTYQRQYSGERYPRDVAEQRALRTQNYRYRSRDPVVQRVQQRIHADNSNVRQQPSFQQRSPEPQQHNPQRQRSNEQGPRYQPAPERAQPAPIQRSPVESRDRGREGPPAAEGMDRGRGNRERDERGGDRGDDHHDNGHDNRHR